jgi:hypothetical protein
LQSKPGGTGRPTQNNIVSGGNDGQLRRRAD